MKHFAITTALALVLSASAAQAREHQQLPPVTVYPPPPPDPIGAFFGAIFRGFLGALPVVPDGAGGFVPFTNSRVMPDGTLRPYDPAIDGYPFQGPLAPMPRPTASPMPTPPQGAPAPSYTHRSASVPPNADSRNLPKSACYDKEWHFTGQDNPECGGPK